MRSARSRASAIPASPIEVPGIALGGAARKRSNVRSSHTIRERFIASEYSNPATEPARRPKRPQCRGPARS